MKESIMGPQRILSVFLLVLGVGLLIIGLNASHSVADQVSDTFTGRFTQATTWYILGGIASAVVGFIVLVGGGASGKDA
jgi:Protein of unknown function (DUF3185)